MRIQREEVAVTKKGHQSIVVGIKLGYLFAYEVNKYTRSLSKKLRLETLHNWHARTRIAQLKARRPTLRESAMDAFADNNLIKFCNNIINAHRIGAFGRKQALWNFMRMWLRISTGRIQGIATLKILNVFHKQQGSMEDVVCVICFLSIFRVLVLTAFVGNVERE